MKSQIATQLQLTDAVYVLQHLESPEFVCVLHEGIDWICASSCYASLANFQRGAGLIEFTKIIHTPVKTLVFTHFYYEGNLVTLTQ
ncbi:hypothetical protein CCAX7_14270 [Capsulimonas corticalis]|uniref:Uncharacterized protein n=1 Tax=Capsulimonas corticalis TaxID=2219043 RepID=A0A402D737_9BACT|nr:hypothetical protein [Capsulimonas corticalis]BDI29376.1 hypothetical protein CCAX7_14270 [Capsulimonas corticalis]